MSTVEGRVRRTRDFEIAAFFSSLLGFFFIPAIVGLVLGILGRKHAKEAGRSAGLAVAAISISSAWLAILVLWTIASLSGSESGDVTGASGTASASPNPSDSPTGAGDETVTREESSSPEAFSAAPAGTSDENLNIVCPFVITFVNDHPRAVREGIWVATVGQFPIARASDASEVAQVVPRLGRSNDDPFIQDWLEVATYITSPAYQSGQVAANFGSASKALVSLHRECVNSKWATLRE